MNPLVAHGPESDKEKVSIADNVFSSNPEVFFSHIHGVGYNHDGNTLLVASHAGIVLYTNGKWTVPNLPKHDYMGFTPVDKGFYSSGHPAMNSALQNPLGLVKASNNGREVTSLAFSGVFDFHRMAAGYYSHAIYVVTSGSHPHLKTGLNYTLDEGKTWTHSGTKRFADLVSQIAVHPTDVSTIAVTTEEGLYLSTDFGESFQELTGVNPPTGVSFSPDGELLVYGRHTIEVYWLLENKTVSIPHPEIPKDDHMTFIAINPKRPNEIVVVTKKRNIYLSKNWGKIWFQIALEGRGLSN